MAAELLATTSLPTCAQRAARLSTLPWSAVHCRPTDLRSNSNGVCDRLERRARDGELVLEVTRIATLRGFDHRSSGGIVGAVHRLVPFEGPGLMASTHRLARGAW